MTIKTAFSLAGIILMLGIFNCAPKITSHYNFDQEQAFSIHPAIGAKLDPEERDRYGLLRGIKDFAEATYYKKQPDGYIIAIVTRKDTLVALNESPDAVDVLYYNIEHHDEIVKDSAKFEREWHIIDYDKLGQPITLKELAMIESKMPTYLGIGTGALGCIGGQALGWAQYDDPEDDGGDRSLVLMYGMGGGCLGFIPGYFIGKLFPETTNLKGVKKYRKPKSIHS